MAQSNPVSHFRLFAALVICFIVPTLLAALGVPPGPDTGRFLRAVEDAWIADDFTGDAAACRAKLTRFVDQGRQQQ